MNTPSLDLNDFLDRVDLVPRQAAKALVLWPLVARGDQKGLDYTPLARALEQGWAEVDEVSSDGEVPNVRLRNRGERSVLVLFGEEIRGAKQNRIANASFLVAAGQDVVIDVSCVEQGRWGSRGAGSRPARFEGAHALVSTRMRKKMARDVGESRLSGGRFTASQGEVWAQVEQRLGMRQVESPTSSYEDYLGARRTDLEELRRAFQVLPDQVGFVAQIGDEVVGIEAVGRADVFRELFPRLVDGYAIDAVDAATLEDERALATFEAPEPFLEALRLAPVQTSPSLGVGRDLRLGGREVEGCALEAQGLVHLTAYPRSEDPERPARTQVGRILRGRRQRR